VEVLIASIQSPRPAKVHLVIHSHFHVSSFATSASIMLIGLFIAVQCLGSFFLINFRCSFFDLWIAVHTVAGAELARGHRKFKTLKTKATYKQIKQLKGHEENFTGGQ